MTARLVGLDLPPGEAFVDALRRVWDNGDAALPIDARLPPPAKAALLDSQRPAEIMRPDGSREARRAAVPVLDGDALVVATSGTTGVPKGVVLTHDALRASAVATSARLGVVPPADRWVSCLPLAHIGGLSVIVRALMTDTALTVLPGFEPEAVVAARREGGTLISLVPSALLRLAELGPDAVDAWRVILLGGSTMPPTPPPNAVKSYGMTETGSGVAYDGLPLDGVELRVVDGQILVRGPMLLRAYRFPTPASGWAEGRPEIADGPDGIDPRDAHGWFATGDAGHFGPDGRLVVEGRIGDVIVTGGEKVWPEPVERVLIGVPGVADVAIGGRPDERWGTRVVAFVVASDPTAAPTLDQLRDAVRAVLPAYAAPHEVVAVDHIPRTGIGKIRRSAIR